MMVVIGGYAGAGSRTEAEVEAKVEVEVEVEAEVEIDERTRERCSRKTHVVRVGRAGDWAEEGHVAADCTRVRHVHVQRRTDIEERRSACGARVR